MPRGVSGPKTADSVKKIAFVLNQNHLQMLEELAMENYRTPPMQEAYLLAKVLEDIRLSRGGDKHDAAARILNRASGQKEVV